MLYPTGYQEMKAIETLIHGSSLDWTVVRIVNPNVKSNVSRFNVAMCLLDAASRDDWIHKMPIVFNR